MSDWWSDWCFFLPSSVWRGLRWCLSQEHSSPINKLTTRNNSISNGGVLFNYGCVISCRDQAAYHFGNTTVTSSNRSYLCNGNEQRLSNCSTVLSDQCSQNTGVYIQCQGETPPPPPPPKKKNLYFLSFFLFLFCAVVDVVVCVFFLRTPPPPPFFSFFLSSFLQDLEQTWVDGTISVQSNAEIVWDSIKVINDKHCMMCHCW